MSEKGKIKIKPNKQSGIVVKPVSGTHKPSSPSQGLNKESLKKWGMIGGGILLLALAGWGLISFFFQSNKAESPCNLTQQEVLNSPLYQRFGLSPCEDTLIEDGATDMRYFLTGFFEKKELPIEVARNLRKKTGSLTSLEAGRPFAIIANRTTQTPSWFVFEESDFSYTLYPLAKGQKEVIHKKRKEIIRQSLVSDVIFKGLNHSFSSKNIPYEVSDQFREILKWQVDFSHLYPSDRYTILFEKIFADSQFVGTGKVLGIEYETQSKTVEAYWYGEKEFEQYYDQNGNTLKRGFLMSPIKNPRITSFFGIRNHPLHKKMKIHKGTDFAAPEGEEIITVADGVVEFATNSNGPNGNWVKIDHGNGYKSIYLHMLSFAEGIRKGVKVSQGQVIGLVGNTGDSTGPHVCFNLKRGNDFVDHITAPLPGAFSLPSPYLERFIEQKEVYKKQMKR